MPSCSEAGLGSVGHPDAAVTGVSPRRQMKSSRHRRDDDESPEDVRGATLEFVWLDWADDTVAWGGGKRFAPS